MKRFQASAAFCVMLLASGAVAQLSFLKLPDYITVSSSQQGLSPSGLSAVLKGLAGMPNEKTDESYTVLTSGLSLPRYFLLMKFISDEKPAKLPGLTLNFDDSSLPGLSNIVADMSRFYGPRASVFNMEGSEGAVNIDAGAEELLSTVKKALKQFHDGPVVIEAPVIKLEKSDVNYVLKLVEDLSVLLDNQAVFYGQILTPFSTRSKRQANAAASSDPPTPDALNVGKDYSDMYPVIFNIILWFMIAMGLTIASVAYCIWFMDPGKDGIIYRMTASRIKKDL